MKTGAFYVMLSLLLLLPVCHAESSQHSSYPRPGNLSDILDCAASNEVFWTAAIKKDPHDPEAHEAMRKAGWYSAVALWIFNVESSAVMNAIKLAKKEPFSDVIEHAKRCQDAPSNWRE